jgi:hypothetical protein
MTNYLARLKAIVSEKGIPHELPLPPKARAELPKGAFGSFGSEGAGHVLKFDDATGSINDISRPRARAPSPADIRASVDHLLAAMAAQNQAARDWWKAAPYDQDGNLTIRSVLTGEVTTIRLRQKDKPQ